MALEETTRLDLVAGTPVNLGGDSRFTSEQASPTRLFIQNVGMTVLNWRETLAAPGAVPGAADTGHLLPPGAGIIVSIQWTAYNANVGFWVWGVGALEISLAAVGS